MISKILRLTIASVLALTVVGSAAAHANPADVIRRGNCSGSSDWKLKLSPEDGRIEVEFEVDSNVAGQTWQVRLTKNGNQIFSGSRVTRGASGSFELRRVTSDPAG